MEYADLKVGKNIIINERPCEVIEIKTLNTGKLGTPKKEVTGIDLFTGKKHQMKFKLRESIIPVIIEYFDYSGLTSDEGYLFLFSDEMSFPREDLQLVDSKMIKTANELTKKHGGFMVKSVKTTWKFEGVSTIWEKIIRISPEN